MARILLIDNEQYIRRLYAEELSEESYEVVTVASGCKRHTPVAQMSFALQVPPA